MSQDYGWNNQEQDHNHSQEQDNRSNDAPASEERIPVVDSSNSEGEVPVITSKMYNNLKALCGDS